MTMRRVAEIAVLLTLAAGLAGCGIKGPLEPPPGEPNAVTAPDQSTSPDGETTAPAQATPKEHKPFILDGLL